jgi:hypothetical protein
MNIFKGLLFLEGYLVDDKFANDEYGPTYGTPAASRRQFADTFDSTGFGPAPAAAADEPCTQDCG